MDELNLKDRIEQLSILEFLVTRFKEITPETEVVNGITLSKIWCPYTGKASNVPDFYINETEHTFFCFSCHQMGGILSLMERFTDDYPECLFRKLGIKSDAFLLTEIEEIKMEAIDNCDFYQGTVLSGKYLWDDGNWRDL